MVVRFNEFVVIGHGEMMMSNACPVFVSFKNLDPSGKPTRDSELARIIFDYLSERGISVFFSTMSLETLGISAYQKAIDDALDSARVLIAVGATAFNLDSQWVRYEWSSFYNDILSGLKPDGRLFVYSEGVDIKDLPRILRQNQVISHEGQSLQCLCNFVANALGVNPLTGVPRSARPIPPKDHIPRLAICRKCGEQFDPKFPNECSSHPIKPEIIGNVGPREDYKDVWKFPCCGMMVVGAVGADGRDVPPHQSPGCVLEEHQA